ncbi:hypothetical protein Rhopal_006204-T1 [Rhodotorula paludigena]|uniref:Uncharacterized protein n=1 Tax=Rhodotorula paludigena TaxID=86838 RepID=A0AAV5GVT0_9BASI|nr:hypothetical protein Rhopal_006204-T1 [Rhodotorula paludigena]
MASPACFLIPANAQERNLLSASSAWIPPPTAAQRAAFASGRSLHKAERHVVSHSDLAQWRSEHPTERLRPPAGPEADAQGDKASLKNYRAPQHPASHVLHSIPPRAPSRSSRSNILSYTIHLATSSRLSSYSSASGSRELLQLAELERDTQDGIDIDEAWFDAEQKTQGLWKVGVNLLQSNRREGAALPASVERRVDLAGLAEEILLSPAAERAVTRIDADSVQASAEVDELLALKPLTAPDSTMHYHTTSAHTVARGGADDRPRVNSVAQSLIDLKFGGKANSSETSPSFIDDKPLHDVPAEFAGVPSSSTSAMAGPSATPHMDYRIVLSQSMRSRARTIFSTSPLPSLHTSYCRRHRVRSCAVCSALISAASERESNHAAMRRKNVPGAGLRTGGGGLIFIPASSAPAGRALAQAPAGGAKKPLVQLVPQFLKLSAALLRDVKERANRPYDSAEGKDEDLAAVEEALLAEVVKTETSSPSFGGSAALEGKGKGKEREVDAPAPTEAAPMTTVDIQVTAEWFDLLTALLVQACLEGYLVDGWTGTEGIETLFGVGCGVWEGREWSAPTPVLPSKSREDKKVATPVVPRYDAGGDDDLSSDEESSDESEDDGEAERARAKEEDTRTLVEAAKLLFGSRDVAQADYERNMRDRTHEFLNVPQDKDLHQHLDALSVKYPLSQFEDGLVDYIEAAVRLFGKPALAKPATSSASSTAPGQSATALSGDADPYALVRYFAPASFATVPSLESPRLYGASGGREGSSGQEERGTKRRRVA